ncbi:phage minor head protein [Desulforamulus aquiferis]|uniref:Phage minor head protein n=1 Tax=Desulforamulus aquiferis TaxID=1397668 RepID=A0AAW7ZCS6_9FIRM|nr:phage minor head protein [Desulforamulus aquiferis]MDO7787136.1 phage minor head protein [Desulforamulus aquiferis]
MYVMRKIDRLLKSINSFIKEEEEEITELVPEFPGLEKVPGYIEGYEKKVAKLLRTQRKYYIDGINAFVAKDVTLDTLLEHIIGELFKSDGFVADMEEETKVYLAMNISELTSVIMEAIDEDVAFEVLSVRTTKWIEDWAHDLSLLMQLNTHRAIEDAFMIAIENGDGIEKAVMTIKDLPQFDRARARTTAITEILAACSRSQWEAYQQSPAVVGKTWRHSGSKKNNPRPAHVKLNNTTIPVDDKFDVNGHEADYPRDPSLPGSERIKCHCVLSPEVDERILGLTKEEKEKIRQEALEQLK